MRNILFKGKRIDNGDWIEGGYSEHDGKTFIVVWEIYIPDTREWDTVEYYENNPHYNSVLIEVDPETVCQYTSLTDKNGRKIFEGDILSFTQKGQDANGIVKMVDGCFFAIIEGQKCWLSEGIKRYKGNVIGNIFDNPELLKGDET